MRVYSCYIDGVQMPETPAKMSVKVKGQNSAITLLNEGEINFLKARGLKEITLPLVLPMFSNKHEKPDYYLDLFERLKDEKRPFVFSLERATPDGKKLFDTTMQVSLEDYDIDEDATNGLDVAVSLTMKEYRKYSTKAFDVYTDAEGKLIAEETAAARDTTNAPSASTYTVQKGDTLWKIAKKYYGNGGQYTRIYEANKDIVSNPNRIYAGQVLTIP